MLREQNAQILMFKQVVHVITIVIFKGLRNNVDYVRMNDQVLYSGPTSAKGLFLFTCNRMRLYNLRGKGYEMFQMMKTHEEMSKTRMFINMLPLFPERSGLFVCLFV
jgi:hypothetical protein